MKKSMNSNSFRKTNGSLTRNFAGEDPKTKLGLSLSVKSLDLVQPKKQRRIFDLFPRGRLSLIAGEPGLGKSQIATSFAALITKGGRGPLGHGSAVKAGKVVIIAPEDDFESVVRVRMELAQANLKKIRVCDEAFDVSTDLERLDTMIKANPVVRAIIIDPLGACMEQTSHNDYRAVRAVVSKLEALANKHDIALIGVMHLNKGSKVNLARIQGSTGFAAAARTVFVVQKTNDNRRFMTTLKDNSGAEDVAFEYSIRPGKTKAGFSSSAVQWISRLSAQDIMIKLSKNAETVALLSVVANGRAQIPVSEIFAFAKEQGISKFGAREAMTALNYKSKKTGFASLGKWIFEHREKSTEFVAQQPPPSSKTTVSVEEDWE